MSDTPDILPRKEHPVDANMVHGGVVIQQAPERPLRAPHRSPTLSPLPSRVEAHSVEAVIADEQVTMAAFAPKDPSGQTAGQTILQWLTYAFWGWTVVAVIWLAYSVVSSFIIGVDAPSSIPFATEEGIVPYMGENSLFVLPYVVAASIILLLLSLVCDLLYSRREAVKKTGTPMVIMVAHAVLFAVISAAAFIGATFVTIQLANSDDMTKQDSLLISLATFFAGTVLYCLVFLRVLNPVPWFKNGRVFSVLMTLIVGGLVVLAFVGPFAQSPVAREDRVVADAVMGLPASVNEYVRENGRLPQALSDMTFSEATVRSVIDKGLITYTPRDVVSSTEYSGSGRGTYNDYRYELCATYVSESRSHSISSDQSLLKDAEYQKDLWINEHPAGKVCYKLKETVSSEATAISVQAMKL